MNMKKIYVPAILLAVLIGLSACAVTDQGKPSSDTTEQITDAVPETSSEPPTDSPEPGKQGLLESLPDADLGEYAIMIAAADPDSILPTDGETAADKARLSAVKAVEDKYSTTVMIYSATASELLTEARKNYMSDMYFADLMAIPGEMLGAFYSEKILANMYSLPFTDYEKEYYCQSVNSEVVFGTDLAGVTGAAIETTRDTDCIFFNRQLAEEYLSTDIYDTVFSGGWTFDTMRALAAEFCAKTADSGIYGFASQMPNNELINALSISQGIDFVETQYGKAPEINYFSESTLKTAAEKAVDGLYKLLYKDKVVPKSKASPEELFVEGKLLFLADRVGFAEKIPSDVDWGILPLPKYDEAQSEYVSYLSGDAQFFCALSNTPYYRNSGLILEALNASAFEKAGDSYRSYLVNYHLRSNDSAKILKMIEGNKKTDFACLFGSGMKSVEAATTGAVYKAITSASGLDYYYRNNIRSAGNTLSGCYTK